MPKKRSRPPARKKPVQVSIDTALVERIDADSETKALGRSAFIVNAVLRYLRDKENELIDKQFQQTLVGKADGLYAEVSPFLASQTWSMAEDAQTEPRRARSRIAGSERTRAVGARK